jgi:hypothetical protein
VSEGIFFGGCGNLSVFFLIAFLNSSCYETPKNAINKPSETTGVQKEIEEKKHFLVMSPDARWTFVDKQLVLCF